MNKNSLIGYFCFGFIKKKLFFQAEPALIYDSVHVFAIGLQTLEQSHLLRISNISCSDEKPWDGGLSLINYINAVSSFHLFIMIN
jgi:glutamate receptor, ionotropic, invertebrate